MVPHCFLKIIFCQKEATWKHGNWHFCPDRSAQVSPTTRQLRDESETLTSSSTSEFFANFDRRIGLKGLVVASSFIRKASKSVLFVRLSPVEQVAVLHVFSSHHNLGRRDPRAGSLCKFVDHLSYNISIITLTPLEVFELQNFVSTYFKFKKITYEDIIKRGHVVYFDHKCNKIISNLRKWTGRSQ